VRKIRCTIEARMGSTRLPGKSMKFLNKNFRLIDFVIANALNSKYLNKKNIYTDLCILAHPQRKNRSFSLNAM